MGFVAGLLRRSVSRFEVAEYSMYPTLEPGDYLLVGKPLTPERGAIVIFPHPRRPAFPLIKRVVGLPGEIVEVASGQVKVNGHPLIEPWAYGPTVGEKTWELGSNEVFVLGDNRPASADDSRGIGPLSGDDVAWQVRLRYWPPSRFGKAKELAGAVH